MCKLYEKLSFSQKIMNLVYKSKHMMVVRSLVWPKMKRRQFLSFNQAKFMENVQLCAHFEIWNISIQRAHTQVGLYFVCTRAETLLGYPIVYFRWQCCISCCTVVTSTPPLYHLVYDGGLRGTAVNACIKLWRIHWNEV